MAAAAATAASLVTRRGIGKNLRKNIERRIEARKLATEKRERRTAPEARAQLKVAKRQQETRRFWSFQKALLANGQVERDEAYWERERNAIFTGERIEKGEDFASYEKIPVETKGGTGEEGTIDSFEDVIERYDVPEIMAENMRSCRWSEPTPVQKYTIPASLVGSDVMVSAQTGSGKTGAFLVPVIAKAIRAGHLPPKEGPAMPSTIIIAPTRELCQQIHIETRKLIYRTEIRSVCCYGGMDVQAELVLLAQGVEIMICTPGRIQDYCDRGVVSLERAKHLVLDEADRMLDMGFEPAIRAVVEDYNMPGKGDEGEGRRQTMLFSATMPKKVRDMAVDFLNTQYLWICVGQVGTAVDSVEQRFKDAREMQPGERYRMLLEALEDTPEGGKTLIFANSRDTVDDITFQLKHDRFRAVQIHGKLSQKIRRWALSQFREGEATVLVATDVAARGLDLPKVEHVVNYHLPMVAEEYVHRIGRTGRLGNEGLSTTFVSGNLKPMKEILDGIRAQENPQPVPDWLDELAQWEVPPSGRGSKRQGLKAGGIGLRGRSAPPRLQRRPFGSFGTRRSEDDFQMADSGFQGGNDADH